MSITPSSLDRLLAEKRAERGLTRQTGALRGLLISAGDTRALLQGLAAELESPLLGDGGLGPFTDGFVSKALSDRLTQPLPNVQQPPIKPGPAARSMHTTAQRPMAGARRRLAPGAQIPDTQSPVPGSIAETRQADSGQLVAIPGEIESIPRKPADRQVSKTKHKALQAKADKTSGPRPVTVFKNRSAGLRHVTHASAQTDEQPQREKTVRLEMPGNLKDKLKPPSSGLATAEIDSRQAREKLTQRVTRSGLATAWESPLKPAAPEQTGPQDVITPPIEALTRATEPAETHHRSTRDVIAGEPKQQSESPGSAPGVTATAGTTSTAATFMEQQIELSLKKLRPQEHSPVSEAPGHATQRPFASSPHPSQRSSQYETETPALAGGLRGLAARAGTPAGQSMAARSAHVMSSAQPESVSQQKNPETHFATAGKSGDSLAELTELLVEEARRAGIDLEKFQP